MTDQAPPPSTPAGWYPEGVNGMRYWDGTAWTEQRAPAVSQVIAPAKRSRNYPGDISLALAIAGAIGTFVFRAPAWSVFALLSAAVVAIIALATAGPRKARTTAIVGLVIGGGLLAVALLLYAVANR